MTSPSNNSSVLDEVVQQLQAGSSMPVELLEIFSEEAEDHLRTIYEGLNRLRAANSDREALANVRRASHTLKGAAGAVNLQAATRLAHRMEDLLDALSENDEGVSEKQLTLLLSTADQLQGLTSDEIEIDEVARQIVELYDIYSSEMGDKHHPSSALANIVDAPAEIELAQPVNAQPVSESSAPIPVDGNGPTPYLRVPLNRLDDLVGLVGELMVNRAEFQHRVEDFESRIEDIQTVLQRMHAVASNIESQPGLQLVKQHDGAPLPRQPFDPRSRDGRAHLQRHDEFDPLEFEQYSDLSLIAQTLSEACNDAEMMSGEFRKIKSSFDSLLRRQQRLTQDTQRSVMRIRMVPLAGIVSRLERTVRTVSGKLGRQVELKVIGERIELDKTVMDEIADPLLHLIRNAIDHGIEEQEVRAAAGKPEVANICLKAINHGTQVTLQISDDGAGINLDRVREKAIQKGLIAEGQQLSRDELHGMIFRPGFSTADKLTDVSGRGVGMDVVGDAVRRLQGTIAVDSKLGAGTTFTIQLPTTVGVTRAVMVQCCGMTFAIPMPTIQKIRRLDPASLNCQADQRLTEVDGQTMRLLDLASHLRLNSGKNELSQIAAPMLILSNGNEEIAVVVDRILGSQDIVVKSLGSHLQKLPGIAGATIGGDGNVIPILDTADLIDPTSTNVVAVGEYEALNSSKPSCRLAMVIDDSISVRRVTENLLTTSGWNVQTAKDGVDALEKLAELDSVPDIFLCDMEMPRMDGLELIRQIREQQEFELTPIVMVTSRASEKHRHKAFEAGATDYVVKPFNDEKLLNLIDTLVRLSRETVIS